MRPVCRLVLPFLLAACVDPVVATAGETVNLTIGREVVSAYLARTPNSRNSSGLVLIHDYWGLNEEIMGLADRFSRLGYVVIAPDLFGGKLPSDLGLARERMHALKDEGVVAVLKSGIDYLKQLDRASDRAVGLVGFGMGGRLSLQAALKGADVRGAVIVYGQVETSAEALAPLKAPVLGIFAGRDPGIKETDVRAFESRLKETGRDVTVIVYTSTGHAFMDESRADFEESMALDAWARIRDWLAVKLQPNYFQGPRGTTRAAPLLAPGVPAKPKPTPDGP